MNSGFEFPSTASSTSTPTATQQDDPIQRLTAMAHGVGKEDSEQPSLPTPEAALYPTAYMPGYPAWPNYYQNFGQQLTPAHFPAWGTCYGAASWPNYAGSKKGRQTYQRFQTSVLEAKFQQSSYVSKKQREELRHQTQLSDRQIKIWFQNRRMKAKKEKQRVDESSDHTPLLPPNPPKSMESMESLEEKKWQMSAAHWPVSAQHYPYSICPQ